MNDPRQVIHRLKFSRHQGEVFIYAGAIQSVRKDGNTEIAVSIRGSMTLYVEAREGLLTELLHSMADCSAFNDAEAAQAAEAIQ